MTPTDLDLAQEPDAVLFRRSMKALGLGYGSEAAEALNTNTKTIQRWASGKQDVPTLLWPLLRLMLEQKGRENWLGGGEYNLAGIIYQRCMGMNKRLRPSDVRLVLQLDKNDSRWWVLYHEPSAGAALVELERDTNPVTLKNHMRGWRSTLEEREETPARPARILATVAPAPPQQMITRPTRRDVEMVV